MIGTHDAKVLVVGAGPTGLTAANELARHGIACRIVDKNPGISPKSRAIAIQARTLEAIEMMRLGLDRFLAHGHPVRRGRIFAEDRGLLAEIDFDHLATRYPYMLLLPQDETERVFETCLNMRGIRVERATELVGCTQDEEAVRATLRREDGGIEEGAFDWLIGCDGAHSAVRGFLGFSFEGGDYRDAFMLADVLVDAELDRSEFQVFAAPEGPLAFFPLKGDRYRIVADNPPADWTNEPTLAQCQALVEARGPGGIRLRDPRWLAKFWLHHRQARELRRGRVFLAGDAAHIHSPAGGQGMNTGIQDAFNLAWKLALVIRGVVDARLLDSYQAERWPVDEAVIRNSDRLTRIMTLKNPVARYLRDHLVPIVAGFGAVRRRAGEAVSELAIGYRGGPLAEEHAVPGSGLAAGDRAPDVALVEGAETVRLYDLIAEGRPILLLLEGADDAQASERVHAAVSAARADDLVRIARLSRSGADRAFRDPKGAAAAYGGSAAYLIRPDGYIAFRAPIAAAATLLPSHLDRLRGRRSRAANE